MFDSWKGFCENIGNLLIAKNVFDIEHPFSQMIANEVILNVDMFESLIF